jgi:hypothetical protein
MKLKILLIILYTLFKGKIDSSRFFGLLILIMPATLIFISILFDLGEALGSSGIITIGWAVKAASLIFIMSLNGFIAGLIFKSN